MPPRLSRSSSFLLLVQNHSLFGVRASPGSAAAARTDAQILGVLRQLCSLSVPRSPYQKGGWGLVVGDGS